MLPQSLHATIEGTETEMPSKTFKLDFEHKRISGFVDGQEAILQMVRKLFETERFAWEIYTAQYGIELEALIGKSMDFVATVLESRVRDCLLADDRVLDVTDFTVTPESTDTLSATFNIITTQGILGFREELKF